MGVLSLAAEHLLVQLCVFCVFTIRISVGSVLVCVGSAQHRPVGPPGSGGLIRGR